MVVNDYVCAHAASPEAGQTTAYIQWHARRGVEKSIFFCTSPNHVRKGALTSPENKIITFVRNLSTVPVP